VFLFSQLENHLVEKPRRVGLNVPPTRTEWHRVYAWRNLSKFAKTLQKGPLVTLEGILRYREVEDEVKGTTFKHRIAEIHAISMKRLSKIEAADDPSDGADDE
jgi:single-strand DNA-binding protein